MEFVVDLDRVTVVLSRPEELDSIVVRVAAPPDASPASEATVHRLGDVLVAASVGRIGADGTPFVRPDAVRFHAAGQVGEGWDEQFSATCARALSEALASGGEEAAAADADAETAADADTDAGADAEAMLRAVVRWPSGASAPSSGPGGRAGDDR